MSSVLVTIIAALINGQTIQDVLAALTTAQWITLAAGVVSELAPAAAEKLGLQHPSLMQLVKSVGDGLSAEFAAKAAQDWFKANAQKAIEDQPGISSES